MCVNGSGRTLEERSCFSGRRCCTLYASHQRPRLVSHMHGESQLNHPLCKKKIIISVRHKKGEHVDGPNSLSWRSRLLIWSCHESHVGSYGKDQSDAWKTGPECPIYCLLKSKPDITSGSILPSFLGKPAEPSMKRAWFASLHKASMKAILIYLSTCHS